MTIQLNIFGDRYDDAEPCFLTTEQGVRVWDRVRHRWLTWSSLVAKQAVTGHVWATREVGIPSIKWQRTHWNGQRYAPGLDSTAGLASEKVVNGEDFVDALGEVPPAGWASLAGTTFTVDASVLTIAPTLPDGGGISQDLTGLTAGTAYVCEIMVRAGTVGSAVTLTDSEDYRSLPLHSPVLPQDSAVNSFSFIATEATMGLGVEVSRDGLGVIEYFRVYEEAELTGSGTAADPGDGGVEPQPQIDIKGPYDAGGVQFWANITTGVIGFDVDSDPPADLWLTGAQVCASQLEDSVKEAISTRLVALGLQKLPCVTQAGSMTAAYLKSKPVGLTTNDDER